MRYLFWLLCLLTFGGSAAQTAATPPPRPDLRIAVLSDFNGPYGSLDYPLLVHESLQTIIREWRPDLFLSAGDLIAGQHAGLPAERFDAMWDAFDRDIARPLREAAIPYAVTMGNHDASASRDAGGGYAFAREREAAERYWSQTMYLGNLAYQDREAFPFRYAFSFEQLFVLVWDASSAQLGPDQLAWAERQLTSPAAKRAAFRIIVGHLPLFGISESKNRPGEVLHDGAALADWLETRGVDLYLSGHHAAYYPAKRGNLILLNSGGIGARKYLGDDAPARSTYTLIDFSWLPFELRLHSYDALSGTRISLESLPPSIDGLGGRLTRLDLVR